MKLSLLSLAALAGSALATSLDPVIIKVRITGKESGIRMDIDQHPIGLQILLLQQRNAIVSLPSIPRVDVNS